MGAVQDHFPYLKDCNKDDMRITSHYKLDLETPITSPHEYSTRAFLKIVPSESAGGTTYDIEVHVGKYWRPRSSRMDDDPGDWSLIRWLPDVEDKILASFKTHTTMEQRMLQDHDKFRKRR